MYAGVWVGLLNKTMLINKTFLRKKITKTLDSLDSMNEKFESKILCHGCNKPGPKMWDNADKITTVFYHAHCLGFSF